MSEDSQPIVEPRESAPLLPVLDDDEEELLPLAMRIAPIRIETLRWL